MGYSFENKAKRLTLKMKDHFLVTIFLLLRVWHAYSCPPNVGWLPTGESCYLVSKDSMDWFAADEFCVTQGGYLAEIKSKEETSVINEFLSAEQYHWIGLNDLAHPGTWSWKTSYEIVDYTNWGPEDPDQSSVCAITAPYVGQQWRDYSCFAICDHKCCAHALCEAENQLK